MITCFKYFKSSNIRKPIIKFKHQIYLKYILNVSDPSEFNISIKIFKLKQIRFII